MLYLLFCWGEKTHHSLSYILGAKSGESIETAAAAYLALQCARSWINDLVSDSFFHAKTDLIRPLQHQKKQAKQRFRQHLGPELDVCALQS